MMAEMIYRAQPSKQELKWELMRRNLESRRRRILDPDANISNITVKKEDLDRQSNDRQNRDNQERQDALALQKYLAEQDKHHYTVTHLKKHESRTEAQKLEAFRLNEQSREQRRDFDLYAPNRLQMQKPYAVDDPGLQGPAAMVNFDGYKYMDQEIPRKKRQTQKAFLQIQTEENRKLKELEEKRNDLLSKLEITIGNKAEDDLKRVAQIERMEALEALRTNKALVKEKQEKRQTGRDIEWKTNQNEIDFWKFGDLLNEEPNKYDRHRRTHWRGVTPDDRTEFFKDVSKQVRDKRIKEAKEASDLKESVQKSKEQERLAKWIEHENHQKKLESEKRLNEENITLGEEERFKNLHLNKEVYGTNQPNSSFWNQFERSGR